MAFSSVLDFSTTSRTNLMRWRLENVLGYALTHPLEIPNHEGRPIYTMIQATDSDPGSRIMKSLYQHAAQRFPVMRIQAKRIREREQGVMSLFADSDFDEIPDPSSLPLGNYPYAPADSGRLPAEQR